METLRVDPGFFQEWAVSPEAVPTAAEFSWLVIDVVRGESLCQQVADALGS